VRVIEHTETWVDVNERLPHTHTVLGVVEDWPKGSEPFIDTVVYFPDRGVWVLNGYDEEPDGGVVKVAFWRSLPKFPAHYRGDARLPGYDIEVPA
jgi:hypothetical protein